MSKNIYLAGKISHNGWRHTIVDNLRNWHINNERLGLCGENCLPDDWPILNAVILGKHNYTGPYFIGDDHGCFHGPNTHGTWCTYEKHSSWLDKKRITKLCQTAIERSDLVFCWLDSNEAYGTLFELGYAKAKGIPIYIATPPGFQYSELWFILASASWTYLEQYQTPLEALQDVLEKRSQAAWRKSRTQG